MSSRAHPICRVTELSAPPVVGEWYLVPTVLFGWLSNKARAWPVFLPRHEDARFFNFKDEHYHVDPRFLNQAMWRGIGLDDARAYGECQRSPLAPKRYGEWAKAPPEPVWAARQCARDTAPYQFGGREQVANLREHFAGQQCRRNRAGWVCPHQNWPMGSLAPDDQGVITCPLHGLRVRAADGMVLA